MFKDGLETSCLKGQETVSSWTSNAGFGSIAICSFGDSYLPGVMLEGPTPQALEPMVNDNHRGPISVEHFVVLREPD